MIEIKQDSENFICILPVKIYYKTEKPVRISELVESLESIEKLIQQFPKVLTQLSGVTIQNTQLFVNEIEAGSIWQDLSVKAIFGSQEEANKFAQYINSLIKEHKMKATVIVGLLLGGLITYGVIKAKAYVANDNQRPQIHNEIRDNTVIIVGAEAFKKSPEEFITIFDKSITAKKTFIKESISVLKPAKDEKNGSIVFGGRDADMPELDTEFIQKAPRSIDIDDEVNTKDYFDVDLSLRKINRDGIGGWEVVMAPEITRRVPLSFPDHISYQDLEGKFEVRADVKVFYKPRGKNKIPTPVKMELINLIEE